MGNRFDMVAIVGPTASGKTSRAVDLAYEISGEILSGDSRQVYKGMDLGTGKDLEDYGDIEYHLIDVAEAGEKYNLYRYLKDFDIALSSIEKKSKFPILCGGSGLYVETALSGIALPEVPVNNALRERLKDYDLEELEKILRTKKTLHNITDIDNKKRAIRAIEICEYYEKNPASALSADKTAVKKRNALIIGVEIPREERRKRISSRLESRLKQGMVDEVKALMESGIDAESLIYYGLEYKFITLYLVGRLSYEEMKHQLEIAIHQFAKRQMTWFRGMERRGFEIHWLSHSLPKNEFNKEVKRLLNI